MMGWLMGIDLGFVSIDMIDDDMNPLGVHKVSSE